MKDKFNKPLDQVIEEYQEVDYNRFDYDPDSGQVKMEKSKNRIPVKTIYTKAKKQFFSCGTGKHRWVMVDRHKHLAKCQNCPKHRFLRAIFEYIDQEGHVRDRDSKQIID